MTISDNRKFADGAMCNPEKGVPRLFPAVATVLGSGGEYFEGDKAHSVAGMSKKIIKK
jgi:hypothetical protein